VVGETVVIIIEDVGAAVGETEVGEELGDLVAVGEDVGAAVAVGEDIGAVVGETLVVEDVGAAVRGGDGGRC
jgi:hypothetical protein